MIHYTVRLPEVWKQNKLYFFQEFSSLHKNGFCLITSASTFSCFQFTWMALSIKRLSQFCTATPYVYDQHCIRVKELM